MDTAGLHIGEVNKQSERSAIGVDHDVALAIQDLLGGTEVAPTNAPVVSSDRLSNTADMAARLRDQPPEAV